ncbi:MAG: hypothetical protein AAF919_18940 [Pseudomonadota bacterium]
MTLTWPYPKRLRRWYLRHEVRSLDAFHGCGGLDHGPAGALQYDFAKPPLLLFFLNAAAGLLNTQFQLGLELWIRNATVLFAIPAVYLAVLFFEWGQKSRAAMGFEMRYLFMGRPDAVAAKLLLTTRREQLRQISQ